MVAMPQVGRKLNGKRKERRLMQRAVQQIVSPPMPHPSEPLQGAVAALIQKFRDEATRMTPEEIAAEDTAFADVKISRLSLPVPDVSTHD